MTRYMPIAIIYTGSDHLKKTGLLLAATAMLFTFSTACSDHDSESAKKKDDKTKLAEAKTKTTKQSSDKKSSKAKKETPKKPEVPYKAIQPSPDAKPLKENYTQEEIQKMPLVEAHGDTRDRSVPFGQTLQKGMTDNTDGPLKKHRLVSFYGNPHSTRMGILGELDPQPFMKKLKAQAQAYSDADPSHPAIPTIELISTIAQRNPGPEGLFYHNTSEKDIQEYAKLAKDNGAILLLDVQLGLDNPLHQAKQLEKYLKLPYVYLAIDTEFHIKKGQVPGVNLGHIDGSEIQKAIQYVSDLTEKNNLPDKVVVVHQFKGDIIRNKSAIKPLKNVEVALNYDGFGAPGSKMAIYHGLVRNEPVQYGGFKLFFKNDKPLLSPKDVIKLDPAPAVIDYQ